MRLTGTSNFLPLNVRGTAATCWIESGMCRGDKGRTQLTRDPPAQFVVEDEARPQHHEQKQLSRATRGILEVDHD
jgi:hypothetical protein